MGEINMKQVKIEKKTLEDQVADLQVRMDCLEIQNIADILKAHAGWINDIENRLKKLEINNETKN